MSKKVSKERQEFNEASQRSSKTFPSEKPQERKKNRKMNTVRSKISQQKLNLGKEQGGYIREGGDTRRQEMDKRETVNRRNTTSIERKASMNIYIEEYGNRQVYIEESDFNWKEMYQCCPELIPNNNNIEEITKSKLLMSGIEKNPGPETPVKFDPKKWAGPNKYGNWTYLSCNYEDPEDRCKTSNQLTCNMCLKRANELWERVKQRQLAEFHNMKIVDYEDETEAMLIGPWNVKKPSEVEGIYTCRKLKWSLSCWGPANGCESVLGDLVDVSPEELRWARMEAEEKKTLRAHRLKVSSMKAHYKNMWRQMQDARRPQGADKVPKLWEMVKTILEKKPTEGCYILRSELCEKKLATHYSSYHQDCWADNASDDEERGRESEQEFNLLTMNGRDKQGERREKWIELWTGKKMKRHEYFRSGEAELDDLADYEVFLTRNDFDERLECVN